MKHYAKIFFVALLALVVLPLGGFAFDLKGTVVVNQTSDTAAKAKSEAMNSARRQILFEILSNYSEVDSLKSLLDSVDDEVLMNFISETSVANEHISPETYSASITMNIDNDSVKKWLTENDVQNWVPNIETAEMFTVFVVIPNGVSDWAELKKVARDGNIEFGTVSMTGNQVFAKMPLNYRTKFTMGIREAGWKYADNGGVLQVWK